MLSRRRDFYCRYRNATFLPTRYRTVSSQRPIGKGAPRSG